MTDRRFYLYFLFKPDDGSIVYVGKGTGTRASLLRGRRTTNLHLHRLIEKGLKSVVALSNLTEDEAFDYERRYIKWLGRRDLETGQLANLTDGGDGVSGHRHSDEFRAAQSERARSAVYGPEFYRRCSETKRGSNNPSFGRPGTFLGKRHSEETRKKIGAASALRTHSEVTREKLRASVSGRRWFRTPDGLSYRAYEKRNETDLEGRGRIKS